MQSLIAAIRNRFSRRNPFMTVEVMVTKKVTVNVADPDDANAITRLLGTDDWDYPAGLIQGESH